MKKDIAESYRLNLKILVYGRLYEFRHMGTGSFFVFLIFMIGMNLFCHFKKPIRCTVCPHGSNRAHALRFCRVILTLIAVKGYLPWESHNEAHKHENWRIACIIPVPMCEWSLPISPHFEFLCPHKPVPHLNLLFTAPLPDRLFPSVLNKTTPVTSLLGKKS